MPDKSKKRNITTKKSINTNTNTNKFTPEQLFAMINQCQNINSNKIYRNISENDIFNSETSNQNKNESNKSSNKDMSKIVKNRLQGEYGEKKFIKP